MKAAGVLEVSKAEVSVSHHRDHRRNVAGMLLEFASEGPPNSGFIDGKCNTARPRSGWIETVLYCELFQEKGVPSAFVLVLKGAGSSYKSAPSFPL